METGGNEMIRFFSSPPLKSYFPAKRFQVGIWCGSRRTRNGEPPLQLFKGPVCETQRHLMVGKNLGDYVVVHPAALESHVALASHSVDLLRFLLQQPRSKLETCRVTLM